MAQTRVIWNHAEEERLLHSPTGPVGRDMARKGELVAAEQRRTCPVSEDGSHGRPPGYMRSRIQSELHRDELGLYVDVGTDAHTPDGKPYPIFVELGTRPHTITSHGDYPLRNAKTGQVFGKTVQHPGTTAQPFIRPSLNVLRGA
ncbi:hypothetical protein C1I95_14735 [Micromonospora craterilacus]|uniref:Uncharacterized protein n=1 Tax=Micromonospora craterilacus TaxID=1655439 RepID=A0A2W2E5H5_9ACTN|nr:hypothetical protein [Micromonospora craterilacus]PZG17803.1 hypothetical protein C1I95_14735 [Micromonospora craterilacus]